MKFARNAYEIRTNFVRICPNFHCFAFSQLSKPFFASSFDHVLADSPSSPAYTPAPIPLPTPSPTTKPSPLHTTNWRRRPTSWGRWVDDVVGWAASLDPSPDVIHIDLRSPTRNSYPGEKAWATNLWRELRRQLPSLKFLHLTPQPGTLDQLLKSMRTNPVGKPKDAHVQVFPTTNLVYTPPNCDMVCLHDLAAGAPADHSLFPLLLASCQPTVVGGFGHRPFPSHHPPTGVQ